MNARGKLMELLDDAILESNDNYGLPNTNQVADYLIAHGVTVLSGKGFGGNDMKHIRCKVWKGSWKEGRTMDRLTIRLKDGHAGVLGHTPDWAVADRLADYEDTGLEPEEIRAIQKKIDDVHRLVKLIDPKKLEHLSYLVDAEASGRRRTGWR